MHKFDIEFSIGDKVMLSMKYLNIMGDRKLVSRFGNLFSIIQWIGPFAYWLNLGTLYGLVYPIFNISLLKPFCSGGNRYLHPVAVYVEDEQKCKVSGILRYRGSGKRRKYLVAYSRCNAS